MTSQLNLTFAREARDRGIKRAADHANELHPSWSDKCYELLKCWLQSRKGEFYCEDFRVEVEGKIETPPHNRAFGGVFMRAAKAGIIERVRYGPVKNVNCHRGFASVWIKSTNQ